MSGTSCRMHGVLILMILAGCSGQSAAPVSEHDAPAAAAAEEGGSAMRVTLAPEQIALLGLATTGLESAPLEQSTMGQATVLSHDGLAQSLADLRTAQAAATQSEAALARLQGLAATPGALGADALEVARRQASADAAQLQLAKRRQQAQFGQLARAVPAQVVEALADGRMMLARVVFPADVPEAPAAASVSLAAVEDSAGTHRWKVSALWPAPAESGTPGRSLFVVIDDYRISEGRRMLAIYSRRTQGTGVRVPAASVIAHEGRFWCYVQVAEGQYERRPIDTAHPVADGYVVAGEWKAGERVVTRGAGVLLAREQGSSEAQD